MLVPRFAAKAWLSATKTARMLASAIGRRRLRSGRPVLSQVLAPFLETMRRVSAKIGSISGACATAGTSPLGAVSTAGAFGGSSSAAATAGLVASPGRLLQ
jgi:hypothetical protein